MISYDFRVPANKQVRYIVHTDCMNEADDQYTLAHILMTPKLRVTGIVAGHFDKTNTRGIPAGKTTQASYDEIIHIMNLMHQDGDYAVWMGATTYLKDDHTPIDSDGARFIIHEAMKMDPLPLYIGMQGSLTDLASAILMEPKICSRMTAIWIGGGDYPNGGQEFNLMQDVHAANVVFHSDMPLWQIPISTYKQFSVSLAELQYKVKPHGKIGSYLFKNLITLNEKAGSRDGIWPHGEIWGLGDEGVIAALMEETEKRDSYKMLPAPSIDPKTLQYLPGKPDRYIRVYHTMNARMDLEDFFCKLAIQFPNPDS